jgi:hypothetical protein
VCDLAYVLLLENWQRQAIADRQALVSRGVSEQLPTFALAQVRLDEVLEAEPVAAKHIDAEQMELRIALGVA